MGVLVRALRWVCSNTFFFFKWLVMVLLWVCDGIALGELVMVLRCVCWRWYCAGCVGECIAMGVLVKVLRWVCW